MTQEAFQRQFKHIVFLKGRVTRRNNYIKTLTRYDKNGSHQSAIKKAITLRDQASEEFRHSLRGRTYEEWKGMSFRLSTLNSQLKREEKRREKIQSKINKIVSLDF